jgi:hypothetical protein
MSMLRVSKKTKKEFDGVQAELIGKYREKFSQDKTLRFLLKLFADSKQ